MDGLLGKRLGKYDIQAEIGRGGMGVVYRGLDTLLRVPVAIKVLPPQLTFDQQFVQRFQQEAVLAASLRGHAGIVAIHDVGQQDGIYYIVMEYLDGVTLEDWLRTRGPMPLTQVISITSKVADALDFAHHKGVIHRDVKPANIMLGSKGRVTLMDFGLVRAAEGTGITRSGTILGTPEYMSPEQALGSPVDGRSDIYSLGIVAYKMLSGKVPFEGTTPLSITYAHVHQPPPSIHRVRADLPLAVEAVINKALAKRPNDRYESARRLADDLARAAIGWMPTSEKPATPGQIEPLKRSIRPPAAGRTDPLRQPARRRPISTAVLFALGGTVAGVVLVFGLYYAFVKQPAAGPELAATSPPISPLVSAAPPPTWDFVTTVAQPVSTASVSLASPAQPTVTVAPVRTAAPSVQETQAGAAESTLPPASPAPSAQCQAWQKRPAPGYGILLVENHIGEEMLLEWVQGGEGQWRLPAKQGDLPGRWWRELPVGHHEFNDSTSHGHGHITVDIQDGQSYVSPIWYNDQKEEKLYPMGIPAGCR